MRLIDSDVLLSKNCTALKGPNDGKYDSCSECSVKPHGYCYMMVRGDEIYNAPTIDAIPVEWLEDRELDYRTTGDKLMSDAFAVVIDDWQKGQEET